MCVRDQALLYYRLLHCGIEETRKVLQGRRSDPSLGVLIGRPADPVSQWACSFNTLEPLRLRTVEAESTTRGSPEHVTFDIRPKTDLPETLSCTQTEEVHSGECEKFYLISCLFNRFQFTAQISSIQDQVDPHSEHRTPWNSKTNFCLHGGFAENMK